eukprot:scaffold90296_cov68-Phaeocystis_antarctica.AAC.17
MWHGEAAGWGRVAARDKGCGAWGGRPRTSDVPGSEHPHADRTRDTSYDHASSSRGRRRRLTELRAQRAELGGHRVTLRLAQRADEIGELGELHETAAVVWP